MVILTYNRAADLAEAVRSAWNQTYSAHEIVVVDDGSTDDTPQVVESLANGGIPLRYLRQPNQELRRRAIAASGRRPATGSRCWTRTTHGFRKLEAARTLIAAGDEIVFVHSRCIHDFELKAGGAAEPLPTVEQRCDPAALMGGWYIKTSSVAIRMTLLDRLDSLFPTDLRTWVDYEPFWRAITLARRIGFSAEPDTVIASTPASLSREDTMVLPRIMDNIESMSRGRQHRLDGLDGQTNARA